MDKIVFKHRVQAVRRRLAEQATDGLIVIGVENVRYLTGFRGHDSWAVVLPRRVVLITDSRYTEQAISECVGCKVVERKEQLCQAVARLLASQKSVATMGVEDGCMVRTLGAIRKVLPVKVKPLSHIVESVRTIKGDAEIRAIRKAAKIAFNAMDRALEQLTPGITERQLAALYDYHLSAYGATPAFETIACFGANGSRNHHQPGGRKLRANDVVLLDFGANVDSFVSDTTRCFAVGRPSDFYCFVYRTVALAQKAAIAAIRPGVRVCQVDAAARQVIADAGLPLYGHGTGHGIGLQVHESPSLTGLDKKTTLAPGHVVTVEPGVYLPGKFGVRLEDDVEVTSTGAKILSRDERFAIDGDAVPVL